MRGICSLQGVTCSLLCCPGPLLLSKASCSPCHAELLRDSVDRVAGKNIVWGTFTRVAAPLRTPGFTQRSNQQLRANCRCRRLRGGGVSIRRAWGALARCARRWPRRRRAAQLLEQSSSDCRGDCRRRPARGLGEDSSTDRSAEKHRKVVGRRHCSYVRAGGETKPVLQSLEPLFTKADDSHVREMA